MSLVLEHVPGQPIVKTHPGGPNVIYIDEFELSMQDFVDSVIQEMTATNLEHGDYRRELRRIISCAIETPGWGGQGTRLSIAPQDVGSPRQLVSIGGLDLLGHDFICLVVYVLTNRNLVDGDDPRHQLVAACRKMAEVSVRHPLGSRLAISE